MKNILLENSGIVLNIDLQGGSYTDFHLKDLPLNPINWEIGNPLLPPFKGHFLCFDRWGPPSEAEKLNGFQHHGEVNTVKWKVLKKSYGKNGNLACSMRCQLPMGGLELTRYVELPKEEPVFFVSEEIKNLNLYGRIYNIVQHVTLAPPFLDANIIIDNNTEKGFEDKENGSLNQEYPVLNWPEVNMPDGTTRSLRQIRNDWPRVSSFVFGKKEKYGWTTAANPTKNLLLGYIWKIEDYPWINYWREMNKGTPQSFGIEFGTTGLHEPFTIVAKKGKIFNRNIYEFIDSGEIIRKSFVGFLTKIPDDFQGVEQINVEKTSFTLKESTKRSRDITFQIQYNEEF
jgi:hypothetical protein